MCNMFTLDSIAISMEINTQVSSIDIFCTWKVMLSRVRTHVLLIWTLLLSFYSWKLVSLLNAFTHNFGSLDYKKIYSWKKGIFLKIIPFNLLLGHPPQSLT